ncbi:MAG: hypothetical protein K6G42_02190 [Lachnospiraceae bacterium]|nr:hypothetical protein [Lachnospiraceae bacterium]
MPEISAPWYKNGLHIVDESFIDELDAIKDTEKSLVTIGSSLSVIPFDPSVAGTPGGYEYHFLVCGNGCWKSDRELYGLYKASAAGDSDVILLEMSFSTFRDMETTITRTIVDKWGAYKITEDEETVRASGLLSPLYRINRCLISIENLWELGFDVFTQTVEKMQTGSDRPVVPGNFRNDYFNYDFVAESCNMTDDMKADLQSLIETINSEHQLIVWIAPIPEGLAATDYGRQYTEYVENEFIPMLNEKGIPYTDHMHDYKDSDFCDGVHLGYEAGKELTEKLSSDISEILEK